MLRSRHICILLAHVIATHAFTNHQLVPHKSVIVLGGPLKPQTPSTTSTTSTFTSIQRSSTPKYRQTGLTTSSGDYEGMVSIIFFSFIYVFIHYLNLNLNLEHISQLTILSIYGSRTVMVYWCIRN